MNLIKGKVCMITGATSGIGKALTGSLADCGAYIIMVCRNEQKGETVKNEIINKTGNQNIELLIIDLSSQSSIRNGINDFQQRHKKLDLLINNAGVLCFDRNITEDGIETNLAVNYLAPFLLTNLLLNTLKASTPASIINVVSEGTKNPIDFENLNSEKKFDAVAAYSQAKQAEILFTFELARRLKGSGVNANCFYPGLVKTNLGNPEKGIMKISFGLMTTLLSFIFTPMEKAIKPAIILTTSKKACDINGGYLKIIKNSLIIKKAYDKKTATRLWKISEKLVKL